MSKEFTNYHVGHIVKIISIYNEKFLNKKFLELDLTTSQSRMLGYIVSKKDENITTRDLEKHFELSHPTVVGILKRLKEKGFIDFKDDIKDKRYKLIKITDKTKETEIYAKEILNMSETILTKGLTDEEIKIFKEISYKIFKNACEVQND